MSRTLSTNFKTDVFKQEGSEVYLVLVEITHASLATPIRVVNNYADVTSNGNTYSAFPFTINLPDDSDEGNSDVTLSIDNIDRTVVDAIRTLTGPPTVTISVILASAPNTLEAGPYAMTLRDSYYDSMVVTGTLAVEDMLNEPYPIDALTPAQFPNMF
jgi:hypothetical protein